MPGIYGAVPFSPEEPFSPQEVESAEFFARRRQLGRLLGATPQTESGISRGPSMLDLAQSELAHGTSAEARAEETATRNDLYNQQVRQENQQSLGNLLGQHLGAAAKTYGQYEKLPQSGSGLNRQNAPVFQAFFSNLYGQRSPLVNSDE